MAKSEYTKEIASIREGIKRLITRQQKEALKELNSRIDSVSKNISGIQGELRDLLKEVKENRERIHNLEDIKSRLGELHSVAEDMKKLDIRGIVSQLEQLKNKIQFIESRQTNLEPLYGHVQKLEKELAQLRASLPMVIE